MIAWECIGVNAIGLALLGVYAVRKREADEDELVGGSCFLGPLPRLEASDRPVPDVPSHLDREIERAAA